MISYFEQKPFQRASVSPSWLSLHEARSVRRFHETFPSYSVTPLHSLSALATLLGVDKILIKDESYRFGLNAFKALSRICFTTFPISISISCISLLILLLSSI